MKKTLNINIGSRVFNIDEDAYNLLSKYLESIKTYFDKIKIDEDIFEDIENRISEKFSSTLDKRQSLNIGDVNNIIKEMGTLEDFKEAYNDFFGIENEEKSSVTTLTRLKKIAESKRMEEINNSGLTKNEIAYRKLTDSQKSVYDQRVELILKSFEWKEYNTTFETINVGLSSN